MVRNKKGQAAVEMAIFGGILLFAFGALLYYMQKSDDQQYIEMEAFRRAQEKANPRAGTQAGGAIDYKVVENRRYVDVISDLGKGRPDKISTSAKVLWAIPVKPNDPKLRKDPVDKIVYKLNEDEVASFGLEDFVPADKRRLDASGKERDEYWVFVPEEEISLGNQVTFNESLQAHQDTAVTGTVMSSTRSSELRESINEAIPYKLRKVCKKPCAPEPDISGYVWNGKQFLYKDTDGQYKYSTSAKDSKVERARSWTTPY